MAALYVDSSTVHVFSLSWQHVPLQYHDQGIQDCVGFYTIQMLLTLWLRAISNHFKSY
jgi:hypothetical protein